jgi:hypothetical protein
VRAASLHRAPRPCYSEPVLTRPPLRRLDDLSKGKNDGSVGGVAYFRCCAGGTRGVFVRPEKITMVGVSFPKTPATAAPAGTGKARLSKACDGGKAANGGRTDMATKPPADPDAPEGEQKNRECCFYIPGCTLNKRFVGW